MTAAKSVTATDRLAQQRAYLTGSREGGSLAAAYFGPGVDRSLGEPLALLHRHG